jgi:hypothetical protein
VSRIGGVAHVGEAVGVMVGVGTGFREWVGGVGVVREMDTGKEREVVEHGRLGFETIISSGYAQMDRQELGHSSGLKEGSDGKIMGDSDTPISSALKFFLTQGHRVEYSMSTTVIPCDQ